jgi:hypothetical protein
MAATNDVLNGNNFGVALVMTSATFYYVHAGCQIRETEWCKPFNVYQWTGKVQAKLRQKVKDDTNLSRTKTCNLFNIGKFDLENAHHQNCYYRPDIYSYPL